MWYGRLMPKSPECKVLRGRSIDAFGACYLYPVDGYLFTTIASLVFDLRLSRIVEAGSTDS